MIWIHLVVVLASAGQQPKPGEVGYKAGAFSLDLVRLRKKRSGSPVAPPARGERSPEVPEPPARTATVKAIA